MTYVGQLIDKSTNRLCSIPTYHNNNILVHLLSLPACVVSLQPEQQKQQ